MFMNWFKRLKNDDFDISDNKRSKRPTAVKEDELQALLNEDSVQSACEFATGSWSFNNCSPFKCNGKNPGI